MYSLALDNSWIIMNEEEMYDVNGGFLGWSGTKFKANMAKIAEFIFKGIAAIFGSVFATGVAVTLRLVAQQGMGFHTAMKQVATNIIKGTVSTAKWLYGVLSANWGWTLGIAAATLLVGITVLGYITI